MNEILEILQSDVSPRDKVEKTIKLLDDKTNRLFAVDCARRALSKIEDPDPRSLKSVDFLDQILKDAVISKDFDAVKLINIEVDMDKVFDMLKPRVRNLKGEVVP